MPHSEDEDSTSEVTYKGNWRLDQLSKPKEIHPKYVKPDDDYIETNVSPGALLAECSMRNDHMARPNIRYLEASKRAFAKLKGEKFVKKMDKKIEESWNTIYNYYAKQLRSKHKKKKHKGDKHSISSRSSRHSKRSRSSKRSEKEIQEWVNSRSQPKKIPKPPPLKKGKKVENVEAMLKHMAQISVPKRVVHKYDPEDDEWKTPFNVPINPHALTYKPTERIRVLATPSRYYQKPEEDPVVRKSALRYKPTPRISELAEPKVKKSKTPEPEDLIDPFAISKNALKYVATPRILELARPSER